jgi:hypothetical protein
MREEIYRMQQSESVDASRAANASRLVTRLLTQLGSLLTQLGSPLGC